MVKLRLSLLRFLVRSLMIILGKKELTEGDWTILQPLVDLIPPFPKIPSPLWTFLMSRNVPAAVELAIIRDGKVLLTKRTFCGQTAYHTPGTYIAPRETFLKAVQRCADTELKVRVLSAEPIGYPVNHFSSPRFHDVSIIMKCEIEGEPTDGEWFNACPEMLDVHKGYWQFIEPFLRE